MSTGISIHFWCVRAVGRPSFNFHQHSALPGGIPSASCAAGRLSINFCQLFMQWGHLSLTSVNFPCNSTTCHQLPSTFLPVALLSTSVNIPCGWEIFHQLSVLPGDLPLTSVYFTCDRPSANFYQLFLLLGDLLPTSINLPCCRVIFLQLFVQPVGLPITFGNFPCDSATFPELPSTFLAAGRPSVNFCPCSVWPGDLLSTFHAASRPSVQFRPLSVRQKELQSKSVNFLCDQKNFCEHTVWPGELPSTSINF